MPVSSSWWFQALIICLGSNWLIISGMLSGCHQDPCRVPGLVTLRSWSFPLLMMNQYCQRIILFTIFSCYQPFISHQPWIIKRPLIINQYHQAVSLVKPLIHHRKTPGVSLRKWWMLGWGRSPWMDKSIGYIQPPSDPFHDFTSIVHHQKQTIPQPVRSTFVQKVHHRRCPGTESLVISSLGLIYQLWGSPSTDGNSRVMLLGTNLLAIAIG